MTNGVMMQGVHTSGKQLSFSIGTPSTPSSDEFFRKQAHVICNDPTEQIDQSGVRSAHLCLWRQKTRHVGHPSYKKKIREKVTLNKSSVQVQTLPPTTDAAKYHTFRVHYQVQVWMRGGDALNPMEREWCLVNNRWEPRKMDLAPVPEFRSHVICCKCEGGSDTKRRTCRKHRPECTCTCAKCKGTWCINSPSCSDAVSVHDYDHELSDNAVNI